VAELVATTAGGRRPERRAGRDGRPWFACFDGYRAVAAMAVLVTHVAFISGYQLADRPGTDQPVHAAAPFLARLDIGVSLFFLISGFLLYRPFVVAHLAGTPPMPLVQYLKRRWLRIIPAYWVALTAVVYVFGQKQFHGWGDPFIYYGLAQIYSQNHVRGGIQQAWTLCTEESFYLFLPLYAAGVRAVCRRVGRPLAVELAGVGLWFLTGVVYKAAMYVADNGVYTNKQQWLPGMADLFALGMLLAVASAWSAHTGVVPRALAFVGRHPVVAWVAAGTTFWVVSTRLGLPRRLDPLSTGQLVGRQLLYGLTSLWFLVPGVFGPQRRGAGRRFLQWRPVATAGMVSYGVYLWHELWIDKYLEWRGIEPFGAAGTGPFLAMLVGVAGLSLLSAAVSHLVVERPFLRLKYRRILPALAAAVALVATGCSGGVGDGPARAAGTAPGTVPGAPGTGAPEGSAGSARPVPTTVARPPDDGVVPRIDGALRSRLRAVARVGQARGLRPDVFAKVGDSITEDPSFLTAIGCGRAVLGDHEELAWVIERFRRRPLPPEEVFYAPCREFNSFTRHGAAAVHGWTVDDLLARFDRPHPGCPPPYDHPVACEVHLVRPAVALVMIGTNDTGIRADPTRFAAGLRQVLVELLGEGVVPVVSTIPPRFNPPGSGRRIGPYNDAIRSLARELEVPLWDYWLALDRIPNKGMSIDGLHPSVHGDGADLTPEGLAYGYNVRNLGALQVLAEVSRQVLCDPEAMTGRERGHCLEFGEGGVGAPRWRRTPSAADPLRVLVLGDSITWDASAGIKAALEATGAARVREAAVLGFGITRGWYPWRTEWRRLLAQERAELVVVSFGVWDIDGVVAHGPDWFRGYVEAANRMFLASGADVVWMGSPRTAPGWHVWPPDPRPDWERGRRMLNGVFRAVAAAEPGRATYVDPDGVLDRPAGRYAEFLPDLAGNLKRARKLDGAHICPTGAELLGDAVLRAVRARIPLPPPRPGWQYGSWRSEGRYEDPPGGCGGDPTPTARNVVVR
jgi:peptidoglycan/LPS O-acetylase OafA/YrhL